MLDTRYHRDGLERAAKRRSGLGPYQPTADTSKSVLGAEQWKWLERQLKEPADLRIIASSIQLVANEHGWETWGNFPHERQRFYDLIRSTQANGVVIISGDRHLIEISCDDGPEPPYPIWDFTSRGLTQASSKTNEPNRFRIGPVKREQNFGVIRIDWQQPTIRSRLNLEGYGQAGTLITRQSVFLNSLAVSPDAEN